MSRRRRWRRVAMEERFDGGPSRCSRVEGGMRCLVALLVVLLVAAACAPTATSPPWAATPSASTPTAPRSFVPATPASPTPPMAATSATSHHTDAGVAPTAEPEVRFTERSQPRCTSGVYRMCRGDAALQAQMKSALSAKQCATNADCTVVLHDGGCSHWAFVGLRADARAAFDRIEQTWQPTCGCRCGVDAYASAEGLHDPEILDGSFPFSIRAQCVLGQCRAHVK